MTAHKHSAMIKEKADNMDLVVFVRMAYGGDWVELGENECFPSFHHDNDYYLCMPQHKESCFHWLNGGEIEFNSEISDGWAEYEPIKSWGVGSVFMQSDYKFRIKPSKEKRWIVAKPSALVSMMYFEKKQDAYDAVKFSTGEFKGGQVIEIEIEIEA